MEAAAAAAGGVVTPFRSILDKPLTQLTEEDISQLTREDCRKYLKEKGMRRPSWNKSQAIQQVISLKALLETTDDSGAGVLRRIVVSKQTPATPPPPLPATPSSANSGKELSIETNAVVSDEAGPCRRNDSPKSIPTPSDCRPEEAADDNTAAPRSLLAPSGSVGQMTIFYCGKVNVYDGVPPDKARAIMQLAASPVQLPVDDLVGGNAFLCCPYPKIDKPDLFPQSCAISPSMQIEKMTEHPQLSREKGNMSLDPDVEGQASRKVSLQRYLEKKRDRVRFKGRKTFGTPPSLEMYFSHHNRTNNASGQSTRSSTGSPPQPRPNNQAKIANFSVDLNEDTPEC